MTRSSKKIVSSYHYSSSFGPSSYSRVLVLSAGKQSEVECRTWGSRPPAEITWWRGSRRLPTALSRTNFDGDADTTADNNNNNPSGSTNLTISRLSFQAVPEDDGQRLTCRADNQLLTNEELEDSVTLSVRCKFLFNLVMC